MKTQIDCSTTSRVDPLQPSMTPRVDPLQPSMTPRVDPLQPSMTSPVVNTLLNTSDHSRRHPNAVGVWRTRRFPCRELRLATHDRVHCLPTWPLQLLQRFTFSSECPSFLFKYGYDDISSNNDRYTRNNLLAFLWIMIIIWLIYF